MLAMRPPRATTADYLEELRKTITQAQWAVQYVEDERRPFAYTIGLHDCGFPEYLVHRRLARAGDAAAERGGRLHRFGRCNPETGELMTLGDRGDT